MNTTQLDCFMTVANFLNFSRAAEQLHISQPAVSHQINTLEDELGVKLFSRTSKSVRLTQEGYLFLQYAGEILKISEISKARMQDSRKQMSQRLVIGCRSTAELHFIQPALERLRQIEQQVVPVLRLIPFDSLENLLEEGNIHVMFSFAKGDSVKVRYYPLMKCPVMCICSPTHSLAEHESLTTERLKSINRIAACRPPICSSELFAVQSQAIGGRSPGQILFCDSQEVMYTLVQTGYAFAIIADLPYARLPEVKYIPLKGIEPLSFGAIYLAKERNPILQTFLEILAETAQNNGSI